MKKIYIVLYLLAHITSISCMETELVPLYRPNNTQITKTVPAKVKPDPILIKKLYNDTWELLKTPCTSKLINLVAAMNDAKDKNIHEDIMGKYSYDLQEKQTAKQHAEKVVFFFGYLKHYNQTVQKTKESLPGINDITQEIQQTTPKYKPNKLAILLNLEVPSNKQEITTTTTSVDSDLIKKKYPALYKLNDKMHNLSPQHDYYSIKDFFLNYIYSPKSIQTNQYLKLPYIDLKKQFYDMTYNLVTNKKFYANQKNSCYLLLQIIEAGKTLNPAKQENDFEYDLVNFPQKTIDQYLPMLDSTLFARQCMGILCRLIKQYNEQRKTKITPTSEQTKAYKDKPWNFALPDAFDSTLFDKKIYAFTKLEKLIDNISTFIYSDDKYKEECIAALYPQKK